MFNIKYRSIFLSLFFVLSLFALSTNNAQAQTPDDGAPCGMEYSPTEGSENFPYKIIERDFTICKEDISYRMMYMLFGASMDSEISKQLLHLFHEPDEATLKISEISPVGRVIQSIYEALTYMFLLVFMTILGYQTLRYIYVAQSSGSFLGDNGGQKKAASVAITSMVVIIMATPVGSVILAQAIIIALSVPAIMLANFFLSAFLNNAQSETTRVEISEGLLMDESKMNSESFVQGKLCEMQTQQAVLNHNYQKGSAYDAGTWRRIKAWFTNDDVDQIPLVQSCNTYSDIFATDGNGMLTGISSEIKYDACNHHETIPTLRRSANGEDYGGKHSCFDLDFVFPREGELDSLYDTSRGTDLKNDLIGNFKKEDDYYNRFSFFNIVDNVITNNVSSTIRNIVMNDELSEDEFRDQFSELVNEEAVRFKNNYLINHIPKIVEGEIVGYDIVDNTGGMLTLNQNDIMEIDSNVETFNLLYLKHLFALNNALGGYIMPNTPSEFKTGRLSAGFGSMFSVLPGKYEFDIKKINESVRYTGLEHIREKFSDSASLDYITANCISTLSEQQKGFDFYKEYQRSENAFPSSNQEKFFNCIQFYSFGEGNAGFLHLLENHYLFGQLMAAEDREELVEIYVENMDGLQEYAGQLIKEAEIKTTQLAAYNYIVKKAFIESFSSEVKRNADFQVLADTRAKGWAGLGTMLLAIASEQSSATTLSHDLASTGRATAYMRMDANNTPSFVHESAFGFLETEEFETFDSQVMGGIGILNTMISGDFKGSRDVSENDLELSLMGRFMSFLLESIFTTPMNYLKIGSGMDTEKSIMQNLNECSQSADCYPDSTHPLNATIMFGQSLLAQTLMALILMSVLKVLAGLMADFGGLSSAKKGSGVEKGASLLKKAVLLIPFIGVFLIAVLKIIALVILMVTPLLMPMLATLIMPAVLLGFLLPTIPYLMSVMVVLGWFLTVFITTIAFPIMLLMMSKIREDGQTSLTLEFFWQQIGAVFLKPALITIALIFSWVLVNISIYYINSTMFTIFSISALGSNDFLMSFVSMFIAYFVYIMVIYFVLQHAFSIILSFSDQLLSMLGLKSSDDANMYQTLSVERMLTAQSLQQPLASISHKTGEMTSQVANRVQGGMRQRMANKANRGNNGSSRLKERFSRPDHQGKEDGSTNDQAKS